MQVEAPDDRDLRPDGGADRRAEVGLHVVDTLRDRGPVELQHHRVQPGGDDRRDELVTDPEVRLTLQRTRGLRPGDHERHRRGADLVDPVEHAARVRAPAALDEQLVAAPDRDVGERRAP